MTEKYQNSQTDPSTKTLQNIPGDLPQKSDETKDNEQKQSHITESSLAVKDTKVHTLEDSFNKRIVQFHQQLNETNTLIKKEITEQRAKYEKVQNYLSQALSYHDEGYKKIQKAMENLQRDIRQMQDEAEAYKIHIESEKKKASRAQETLTQLSAEKEESHHNLEEGYRKLLHEKECIEKQNQSQQILIEKQRLKIENLEKKLQQKGILKELHSPIDQRYDKPTSKEPLKDSQTTKIQDHSQQTLLTTATKDQIVGDFTEQVKNLHPRSHTEASVACQFVDTPMNNSHTKVSVNDQLAKDQPPETPVQGITNSQLKVTKRLLSKQLLEKFKPTEQEHLSQSRPTATTKQIPVS